MNEDFSPDPEPQGGEGDPRQHAAVAELERLFDVHRERVFFSRQLEVRYEAEWFHWVTNRALRELVAREAIRNEVRPLATGGSVTLMWHRSYRYYRREASRLMSLVEEYADPNIGAALGLHGESMVLEGFARKQFVMHGKNTRSFSGRTWARTGHDLDFIFERDRVGYGVEVKNTLGYMDHEELQIKIELCQELGVSPVFAVRMLPKSWTKEVIDAGGFALILKYQLYPWAHRELAKRVRDVLELPVDAPRALQDGTMERFLRWHERQL
ncbi:MAG: hypothetical protein ACRDY4_07295 [Acidimicrobiia bacterium]